MTVELGARVLEDRDLATPGVPLIRLDGEAARTEETSEDRVRGEGEERVNREVEPGGRSRRIRRSRRPPLHAELVP